MAPPGMRSDEYNVMQMVIQQAVTQAIQQAGGGSSSCRDEISALRAEFRQEFSELRADIRAIDVTLAGVKGEMTRGNELFGEHDGRLGMLERTAVENRRKVTTDRHFSKEPEEKSWISVNPKLVNILLGALFLAAGTGLWPLIESIFKKDPAPVAINPPTPSVQP